MAKPTNPKLYKRAMAIVKARVKKWPSAYASGAVVRCRRGEIWKGVK